MEGLSDSGGAKIKLLTHLFFGLGMLSRAGFWRKKTICACVILRLDAGSYVYFLSVL